MKDLTKGRESTLILTFSIPMIIGNVFQQMYNVVDSIVVGQHLGRDALAAVGASFPILFAIVALAIGVTMGGSVLIAQYFGAKQFDQVKRASDTLNIFLFFAGILISILGYFFSDPLFDLMSLPPELKPMASQYLHVIMIGMVPTFGYNSVSSILRGMGDSKSPLYFLIFSTILNAVLAVLFVMYFDWGIPGVGYATVIANFASWFFAIIYVNKKYPLLRINPFKKMVFDRRLFSQALRIGLPSGVQQTFVAIGMVALMKIVNGFGVTVIAAYTAASRIDSLISMPAMNFSAALSAFVGQNIGAGKLMRVKRALRDTLLMSGLVCVLLSILIYFQGENIIRIFLDNHTPEMDEVVRVGKEYLVIVCSFYILFSSMFIINGMLRGAGATVVPMITTICSLWLCRIPVAYVLSKQMGEQGIWWAIPIAWSIGLLGACIYYASGKWKNKSLVTRPASADYTPEKLKDPRSSRDYTGRF